MMSRPKSCQRSGDDFASPINDANASQGGVCVREEELLIATASVELFFGTWEGREIGVQCGTVEPDLETLRAAQQGDLDAKAAVAKWLTLVLWDYYATYFSTEIVHDVTHELFVEIWPKLLMFDTTRPEPLMNWVARAASFVAKRQTRRWRRSAARRAKLHRVWVWSSETTCGTALDKRQQREVFYRSLEILPPKYRGVLEHFLAGGSDETYAKAMGITRSTVRAQRKRAIEMLRQVIARELGIQLGDAGRPRSSSPPPR